MKKGILKLCYYMKGKNNNWYCDYYYYNGEEFQEGTTRATGYGYDKQSTCVSNAINKFNKKFNLNKSLKWESETSAHVKNTRTKKTYYGIYKNKDISHGIGLSSVLNCLECFTNVNILVNEQVKEQGVIKLEIKEGVNIE